MENKKKKILTIDDLLNSLQDPTTDADKKLVNDLSTWKRIGDKDKFDELGLDRTELTDFLKEWINDNPYNDI